MTGRPDPPSSRTGAARLPEPPRRPAPAGGRIVRGERGEERARGARHGSDLGGGRFRRERRPLACGRTRRHGCLLSRRLRGLGSLGGVLFSAILRLFEGRRGVLRISLRRASAWGGAPGLLLSGISVSVAASVGETTPLGHFALLGPVFALCGAVLAAGLVALVRRGGKGKVVRSGAEAVGLVSPESRR